MGSTPPTSAATTRTCIARAVSSRTVPEERKVDRCERAGARDRPVESVGKEFVLREEKEKERERERERQRETTHNNQPQSEYRHDDRSW
jgi:hypothetical protein